MSNLSGEGYIYGPANQFYQLEDVDVSVDRAAGTLNETGVYVRLDTKTNRGRCYRYAVSLPLNDALVLQKALDWAITEATKEKDG